jgi:hypothetical protein
MLKTCISYIYCIYYYISYWHLQLGTYVSGPTPSEGTLLSPGATPYTSHTHYVLGSPGKLQ